MFEEIIAAIICLVGITFIFVYGLLGMKNDREKKGRIEKYLENIDFQILSLRRELNENNKQ